MRFLHPASAVLLAPAILAGLFVACGGSEEATDAATSTVTPSAASSAPVPPADEINTSPATWLTPPPWDCKGTPPAGWASEFPEGSGPCVVIPTPACAQLSINGGYYCGPANAEYHFGCGPESATPCKTTVILGESTVIWETDGKGTSTIVEWQVRDKDQSEFASLRPAFSRGVPEPTDALGTPPVSPGASAEAD
jgi:hypothetical protein